MSAAAAAASHSPAHARVPARESTPSPLPTTTAGPGVPPEITEILLTFQFGHMEVEVGRVYRHILPQKGDGLFLFFDDHVHEGSLLLKFEVSQVCHVCLNQAHIPDGVGLTYRVSNQAMLYVIPRDNKTISYCQDLTEDYRVQKQAHDLWRREQGEKVAEREYIQV